MTKLGYWRTRSGKVARILCDDAPDGLRDKALVGYVEQPLTVFERESSYASATRWQPDGTIYFSFEDGDDLVDFLGEAHP